ncbi:MAG: M61 family metallopeptidase [Chlorobiales bacterium]|jgi:predicted metalloprotease with PDZ domain|nr:M61 family metallopeptidase [Chlorobiales bacterium]
MSKLFLITFILVLMPALAHSKTSRKTKLSRTTISETDAKAHYQLKALSPNLHLFQVTLTVENQGSLDTIDFRLPAWRPGRYMIQNYASNVQEFRAFSGDTALDFQKLDKQTWQVHTKRKKEISVQYKYYAAGPIDAGNSYIGREELYFNGSNLFVYTNETRFSPVTLQIDYPDNWKIASQLQRVPDKKIFLAETYDDLIDSPTLISPTLVNYPVKVRGAQINIYFSHDKGIGIKRFNKQKIQADVTKIVEAQFQLMEDVPFKEYAFLYHMLPIRFFHGVEHKNSSSFALGPYDRMDERYDDFLGITSHEFYHVWNVKRILPDVFVRYDYSKEVHTPLLYVSEGFTSYYGDLVLARTGLWPASKYFSNLSETIATLQNAYGRKVQPVTLSSFDAWLSGYGAGRLASSISFYTKGELIGLLLDLEIRHRTENKASLDEVMHLLNTEFAQQGKGFSATDFEGLVDKVGRSSFADFFKRYVHGTEELPYQILRYAGLELRKTLSENPYLGAVTDTNNGFPVIKSVVPESPAHQSGLDQGDMLIAINGHALLNRSLQEILCMYQPGDTITVSAFRDETLTEFSLTLGEQHKYEIKRVKTPTMAQKEFYESWLSRKWDETE